MIHVNIGNYYETSIQWNIRHPLKRTQQLFIPIWSYLPDIISVRALPFVWENDMCVHACTDVCVKFCDDLWGDTQENDCPYGGKAGVWE